MYSGNDAFCCIFRTIFGFHVEGLNIELGAKIGVGALRPRALHKQPVVTDGRTSILPL